MLRLYNGIRILIQIMNSLSLSNQKFSIYNKICHPNSGIIPESEPKTEMLHYFIVLAKNRIYLYKKFKNLF